jgi:hypothetical protein
LLKHSQSTAGKSVSGFSGRTISFKVLKKLGENTYTVLVHGKKLSVKSALQLKPGIVQQARLQQTPQGLVLHTGLYPHSRGHSNEILPSLISLLNQMGIPFKEEFLSQLSRYSRRKLKAHEEAFLLLLADKRLVVKEEALSLIFSMQQYSNDGESEGRRDQNSDDSEKDGVELEESEYLRFGLDLIPGIHAWWVHLPLIDLKTNDRIGQIKVQLMGPHTQAIHLEYKGPEISLRFYAQNKNYYFWTANEELRQVLENLPHSIEFRENLGEYGLDTGAFDGFA